MQKQPHWRRLQRRTEETAEAYAAFQKNDDRAKGDPLMTDHEAIVESFTYWNIMFNRFPYDRYFAKTICLY